MPKIWMGRTTLNGEKKEDGLMLRGKVSETWETFHGRFLHFDIGVKEKTQNVHLKLIFCRVLSWFNLRERIQDPVSVLRELLRDLWVFE